MNYKLAKLYEHTIFYNSWRMDIEYVDVLTGENLSSIQVANMDLIYWSVRSSSRRGGYGEVDGGKVVLASCEHNFIKMWCNIQVIIYLLVGGYTFLTIFLMYCVKAKLYIDR